MNSTQPTESVPCEMTTAVDELKTVLTRHQRDWAAPWASDGHGTLVGRGADLDWIGAFIAGVPHAGGPLLLMGELGVGKTALLAAGGRQAKASGICVLATAGVEYKARLSYVGVQQLLDATAGRQPASHQAFRVAGRGAGACGRPGTWHLDPRRSPRPRCRCSGRWRAASRRCWRSTNPDAEADSPARGTECGPSRCGHHVRPGEDRAIGRFTAAPHRHDTGQEAPVHAARHR
jgi:hypothetical protein